MSKRVRSTLALLAVLVLVNARPAHAQTETVLYSFCSSANCADGSQPQSRLTSDGKGNFYGTTHGGGAGYGTVFELSPNGSGGWNETVIYSFTGGADGANPYSSYVMFDSIGNLYGTTYAGGAYGYGVVFELSPEEVGWAENVLYSFTNTPDGAYPVSGLLMDSAGNLYGSTFEGGYLSDGAVFELSPSGGGWQEKVIYAFDNTAGYCAPSGLTMDAAGNIFGTTFSLVVELSPTNGLWNGTAIYNYAGTFSPSDTLVLDQAGNLYGTNPYGGGPNAGIVFMLSTRPKVRRGRTVYPTKTLYVFRPRAHGVKDGSHPSSGIVFDAAGNIYGTTASGGTYGQGTVFELMPVNGKYQEKILWNFNGTDGAQPSGSLALDRAGNLYGTTSSGGSSGVGVVFEVTP